MRTYQRNQVPIFKSRFRSDWIITKDKSWEQYIIVLVDYLTKWVEAESLKEIGSNDVIKFLKKVFAHHGVPELLITNNGS